MGKYLAPAFRLTLVLTVLTGLLYPGLVTGVCQLFFPHQANGSLVYVNGQAVGSALLGQNFAKPGYFHPRPSAAGNDGYDPMASGGSNYGPTSQKLIERVRASIADFRKENPHPKGLIPADLLTASGSGLDPDISPASALAQAGRVARARGVSAEEVQQLIASHTHGPTFGFMGEPRVNVLELNLNLDRRSPPR